MICLLNLLAVAAEAVVVNIDNNIDNFVRADSSLKYVNGEANEFVHIREPQPLDVPSAIRMNRESLYSGAIVDISKGASLTIAQTNGRYVSVIVINEGHYVNKVYHGPGTYKLTIEDFDTPLCQYNDTHSYRRVRSC